MSFRKMQLAPSRYRWVVFGVLAAAVATRVPVGISLGVLLPDITSNLGLSAVQQGWLGGALNLGNTLLGIPAAWLLSRYSPRLLLTFSTLIAATLTFAQGLAPTFGVLLAARVLSGVLFVSMSPARTLLMQQWFPLREIALINGIQIAIVGVAEALTLSLTPFLLLAVGGWRNVMRVFGALAISVAVMWLAFGRERAGFLQRRDSSVATPSPILVLLHRRVLWLVALGQFGAPAFWWAYATFWPSYMQDRYGLPLATSGFLFGLTSLGMGPAGLLFGWLCSRHPSLRQPVMWACSLALFTSALAMLLTDSFPLLFVACLLGGFGWGFVPIISSVPFELPDIQPREVAIASSFLWTTGSLGGLVGPVLAGWLIETWGGVFPALAALSLLSLAVTFTGVALGRLPKAQQLAAGE